MGGTQTIWKSYPFPLPLFLLPFTCFHRVYVCFGLQYFFYELLFCLLILAISVLMFKGFPGVFTGFVNGLGFPTQDTVIRYPPICTILCRRIGWNFQDVSYDIDDSSLAPSSLLSGVAFVWNRPAVHGTFPVIVNTVHFYNARLPLPYRMRHVGLTQSVDRERRTWLLDPCGGS